MTICHSQYTPKKTNSKNMCRLKHIYTQFAHLNQHTHTHTHTQIFTNLYNLDEAQKSVYSSQST
jgi:hypothetical protein